MLLEAPSSMSTIEEVRAAERNVQQIVEAFRKTGAFDPNHLSEKLRHASDEYAGAVHELNTKPD